MDLSCLSERFFNEHLFYNKFTVLRTGKVLFSAFVVTVTTASENSAVWLGRGQNQLWSKSVSGICLIMQKQ